MEPKKILLVDDDPSDVELMLIAIEETNLSGEVAVASNGSDALDYLYRRGRFVDRPAGNPEVVFLDLKMPQIDGSEVLRQIKEDQQLKSIPVVVLTSSRVEADVRESYNHGANAYVVKPVAFEEFSEVARQICRFWALTNETPRGQREGNSE